MASEKTLKKKFEKRRAHLLWDSANGTMRWADKSKGLVYKTPQMLEKEKTTK